VVSTIPFIEDWVAFDGDYDVWCTSSEFVKLCCGDSEEHAILLCNYFLHLYRSRGASTEAYCVIGVQQPEGDTCWVYTDQSDAGDSAGTLWDPAKGNRFAVTDKLCPLKQVIMLFNNQNLWVNIQDEVNPGLMEWDLKDTDAWLPFFNEDFPIEDHPVVSVQAPAINYMPFDQIRSADEISQSILKSIKDRVIAAWEFENGPQFKVMNRILNPILKGLEQYKCGRGELKKRV